MKRKIALVLILIFTMIFLSGCWSKYEVNELAIVTALGFDKSKDGYEVTAQILNPGEVGAKKPMGRTPVEAYYKAGGETVFEAIRRLTLVSSRRIYIAHVRVIVFGEDMAREGISKALDFLSRDHETRTDFYIMVAKKGKAKDILGVLTPIEMIPANKIFSSLRNSEKLWGPTYTVKLDEILSSLISKRKNPVLTGIVIKGDPKIGSNTQNTQNAVVPVKLEIDSLAGFKGDKLVGWLNEDESIGYNYIMGNVKSTVTTVTCKEGGNLSVEIMRTKSKIKSEIVSGKPIITIELLVEGNIGDVECNADLTKTETIIELESKLEKDIIRNMDAAVKKAQNDLQSDIFGFGDVVYKTNPKVWESLKDNWNKGFIDLKVNYEVDAKIRGLGTIVQPIQ